MQAPTVSVVAFLSPLVRAAVVQQIYHYINRHRSERKRWLNCTVRWLWQYRQGGSINLIAGTTTATSQSGGDITVQGGTATSSDRGACICQGRHRIS